jgi:hypothetical protein
VSRPIIHNKWWLAVAVVWAFIAVANYDLNAESTLPKHFWIVNAVAAVLALLVAFKKPNVKDPADTI